jgi:hypothetical protein
VQTAFATLFAPDIVDHPTDSLDLIDPSQQQTRVRSILALQLDLADSQCPLNDPLHIRHIVEVDDIDAIDRANQDPSRVDEPLGRQLIMDTQSAVQKSRYA